MNKIVSRIKTEYFDIWHTESSLEQFQRSFEVFEGEIHRSVRDIVTKLSKERAHLVTAPEFQRSATPFVQRFRLYDKLIEEIEESFTNNLNKIILTHCDEITSESIQKIRQKISQIILGQMERAKQSESSFASSIGKTSVKAIGESYY